MIERFIVIDGVGIEDDLTGKIYTNFMELCAILNQVNRKSDKNVELYFDVLEKKNILRDKLKLHQDVCRKHNIYSVSNLEDILNNMNIVKG